MTFLIRLNDDDRMATTEMTFLHFLKDDSVCFVFAGKEVLLLMQALNTLSTPEEKLAALCKMYADLVRTLTCICQERYLRKFQFKHCLPLGCLQNRLHKGMRTGQSVGT